MASGYSYNGTGSLCSDDIIDLSRPGAKFHGMVEAKWYAKAKD